MISSIIDCFTETVIEVEDDSMLPPIHATVDDRCPLRYARARPRACQARMMTVTITLRLCDDPTMEINGSSTKHCVRASFSENRDWVSLITRAAKRAQVLEAPREPCTVRRYNVFNDSVDGNRGAKESTLFWT